MKVLHIHFGKEGGAERFFVNLAGAFADDAVEQQFVIRPGRTWGDSIAALGPVKHSNFRRFFSFSRPLARAHIRQVCKTWKPDAIMSWMPRAAQAVPADFDGVRLCRLGDYPANLKHFGNCDVLVGNTPGIVAHCRDLGWDRGLATISNFPKVVDIVPVNRADLDTPEDAPLLVTGGRFVPRKGMDIAIRTAADIPGLYLWLIGDGQLRAELEALTDKLGIRERVRFTGWVDEPIHHIAAGDAFLLPSRHEPLGNVLLEAWRASVPSVSSRCEGPDWFMRDGVDGLMVPIDDVPATTDAVRALLSRPRRARRFATSAHDRLDEMFSVEAVVRSYRELFDLDQANARALR